MQSIDRTVVNTINAPQPLGAYSQAIQVQTGKLLFIAGQIGVNTEGHLVGEGDVAAQTRQVFENLGSVLAAAGAGFSNVVEFTTYLVGRESIQPFIAARTELFPTLYPSADYPPNTLLVVAGLVQESFLVEIKAIAVLP